MCVCLRGMYFVGCVPEFSLEWLPGWCTFIVYIPELQAI